MTQSGTAELSDEQLQKIARRYHLQQRVAPFAFLAPAFIMFAIFVLWPILQSIYVSFHKWDGLSEMTFVGLDNYIRLFQEPRFYISLWNNIQWLVLFMLAPVFGLAIALFLNQNVFGIRAAKSIFFMPFVISQVVIGLIFSWFYNPRVGLLNKILETLGLGTISPLSDPHLVTIFLIIAGLYPQIAYCMILYLTGLNNIDREQIEAGRMDGANGWRMLWHIILPQLRPATFLAVVVTVIGALRSFDIIAIMSQGGPYGSSYVLAYYMYDEALNNFRMGYGAAIAVILFLIMMVYIAFFLWRMLRQEAR